MKQKREIKRNWLESVLRWNLINGAYAALRPVVGEGRMMQVRYEDLLREPEKTIRALGDFIGIDLTDTARSVADQAILLPGHLAVGNSFIRGSQAIRLNPHDDWREKMSVKMQKRVWRLTRVSMGYFNYEK